MPSPIDNPIPQTSLEAAIREVREETEVPQLSAEELASHPKAQEEYEFTVEIVDGAGRKLGGKFVNRILTSDEKGRVGLLIAKLTKNAPWHALDPDTQYLYTMMAHLALSLKKWPSTFSLEKAKNMRLVDAVYQEVAAHETYFLGPPPSPKTGDDGGEGG